MNLVKNDLRNVTQTIHSEERYTIVKLANYLLINIYLPCVGTKDRLLICEDLFENVWSYRERFVDCECLIPGDFNLELDNCSNVNLYVSSFLNSHDLVRCDSRSRYYGQPTYVNFALNHQSCIAVSVACSTSTESKNTSASNQVSSPDQLHLRWDKTDLNSYYFYTGHCPQPYFSQLEDAVKSCDNMSQEMIDTLYNNIISVLIAGARLYVPVHQKFFLINIGGKLL